MRGLTTVFQRYSPTLGRMAPFRRAAAVMGTTAVATLVLSIPVRAQLPAPPVSGDGRFQVGGYGVLTLSHSERPEETERPEVSELIAALMAWGQISPRASYLVELDMAKRTTKTWTGRESDRWVVPMRLYVEYTGHDLFRIRAGRFLTPVGQWNERHAEPLTWTPTRPLTTYRPFAKSVNGVMVAGGGAVARRDVGYALFWAPSSRLGVEAEENAFRSAVGGRIASELHPGLTVGLSAVGMRRTQPTEPDDDDDFAASASWLPPSTSDDGEGEEDEDEEREEDMGTRALLGADLRWERERTEFSTEATWLPGTEHQPGEGGGFAQLSLQLHGPLWAVGRVEAYRLADQTTERVGFAGVTYRSLPRAVVKFGWQFSHRPSARIPDGWFLSFSSLF